MYVPLTFYHTESKESSTDKGDTTADTSKTDEQEQATGGAVGGGGAGTVETPPLMIDGKECLPFQLQISYNNLDGAQCNRVITQVKPITKDRQVAEAGETCMGIVYICSGLKQLVKLSKYSFYRNCFTRYIVCISARGTSLFIHPCKVMSRQCLVVLYYFEP